MAQFKVGDAVTLCASIRDFCFNTGHIYDILDINISTGTCAINYTNFGCLGPSGIQLDFQWTNDESNTPTHSCQSSSNIKLLGSANTNSQGIASKAYTITQNDLDLFNANTTFDLRVCIRNTPYVNALAIGKTRNQVGHVGDNITIIPSTPPQASHEIRFNLADNQYLSNIQENIVEISARLASGLQFVGVPVQYIRSEMDVPNSTLTVFVRHTGIGSTLYDISPNIHSMAVLDDIKLFAEMALTVIIAIVVGYLVGIVIASGGWAALSIVGAIVIGSQIFILGYLIYDVINQVTALQQTIKVVQAKNDAGTARDAGQKVLDDTFSSQPYTKDSCLTWLTGSQAVDSKYLDTLTKELTSMQLSQIKQTYLDCTNAIINTFKASPGAVSDCNTARAGFATCKNAVSASTNTEFGTKYTDPNAPKDLGCGPDCQICIPLIEKCASSGGTGLLALGLVGVVMIGMVTQSKGGGTITVKAEK